jgi:ornithine cyclodeaminase/alanine dehydrogenase-like protein (mu-crystallin family)
MNNGTLLLSRDDVERFLTPDACIAAVEDAFRQLGLGQVPPRRLPFTAMRSMQVREPNLLFLKRSRQ